MILLGNQASNDRPYKYTYEYMTYLPEPKTSLWPWCDDCQYEYILLPSSIHLTIVELSTQTMASNSNENDDDFFGDDQDALAELDARAQEQQYRNLGYLEALEKSSEQKLQQGFEDGYRSTFDESVKVGELLAEAALQGRSESVERIKKFLENMERGEKHPPVTQDDLRQVCVEVTAMSPGTDSAWIMPPFQNMSLNSGNCETTNVRVRLSICRSPRAQHSNALDVPLFAKLT